MFLRSIASQEDSVKINIVTELEKLAELRKAICNSEWPTVIQARTRSSFVRIERFRKDDSRAVCNAEVELVVEELGWDIDGKAHLPNRDEIDKVWDKLGIFPRKKQADLGRVAEELKMIFRELQRLRERVIGTPPQGEDPRCSMLVLEYDLKRIADSLK